MRLALAFVDLPVPLLRVLHERAVWWCHHAAAGPGAQALIAHIGDDLLGRAVSQVLDQAQLPGVGDVGTGRLGWAPEQEPAAGAGEGHCLDGVLLVLAGGEIPPIRAADGRPADRISVPSTIPVCPLEPRCSMTSARVRSRTPGAAVQPRWASSGRTSPTSRMIMERSTPNQQASRS